MATWIHSAVVATTLAATVAVGIASASLYNAHDAAAPKGDRLPVVVADAQDFVTVETREAGVSILKRIQVQ